MADSETEKLALKSKQIEAERLKAVRDLEKSQQSDKTNLAFLDPKATKVKGWSNDPDVIIANTERMGNRALVFAVSGALLSLIGYAGSIVTSYSKIGLGGAIISTLPSMIGYACFAIAILLGLIAMGRELYLKIKKGAKLSSIFWTGFSALFIVVLYFSILILLTTIR